MKKPRKQSEASLKNLKKAKDFSKDNQPSPEAKSQGQLNASIKRNLLETLRTNIQNINLIDEVVRGVSEEVANGNYKNAIKLIEIAKENEKQVTELQGALGVQKIYISPEQHKSTEEHIETVINDQS
jgi:hypothetical protein